MPTLRALIVANERYDNNIIIGGGYFFKALEGCIRDAEALRQWLEDDPFFDKEKSLVITRYNEQATKQEIVRLFHEHLGKAEAGDSVLFYYSGHGTSEVADTEVWAEETDGRIEGIACYYDQANHSDFILADKELRYLLRSISKPGVHIATLFDCCHAGDNTRAALRERVTLKQADGVFVARPWEHFIFHKEIPRQKALGKKIQDLLPEGDYVSLSAAESDQGAVETTLGGEQHGVFSYYLLEVLRQSRGNVSYRDLTNQIRNRIRFRHGQRSKIYAPQAERCETGFLQKPLPDTSAASGTITFNPFANQYRIDRGILARVVPGRTQVLAQTAEGKSLQGRIASADLLSAEVIFEQELAAISARPEEAMTARLEKLGSRPLRVFFQNKDLPDNEAQALSQLVFSAENQAFVVPESEEERADYTLSASAGMLYFSLPGDWFRPLVLPLKIGAAETEADLLAQLQHMAQWHFLKEIENSGLDAIAQNSLQIEAFDQNGKAIDIPADVLEMRLSPTGQTNAHGQMNYESGLQIRLSNLGTQKLYVGVLWFSSDFGVTASEIDQPDSGQFIPPQGWEGGRNFVDLEMFGSKTITLFLDDATRLFHRAYGSSTLKFIFSTEPFETKMLDLEGLEGPELLSTRGKNFKRPGNNEAQTLPQSGWNTRNLEVRTLNPEREAPDFRELNLALGKEGDPYLGYFLAGIYLENKSGPSVGFALKSEMDVLEKGIFMDGAIAGANYWANWRRNKHFEKMAKQYPERPKIVSEGDSWFQHPLLDDIIDNVGRFYPTYCLASAGDTIRNYFAKNEISGALQKVQPAVLLLSGGGNDILGEDLPKFLHDKFEDAAEGEQPERFFNDSFAAELDSIMALYRSLFIFLKAEFPQLKIVTHSYDYPRPVQWKARNWIGLKKRSWIGKYLDEKGIERTGDRKALVRYMLDQFNLRMRKLTEEYPEQVYHLDLRNTVRDPQWDDEIHPDNAGFQKVSTQFLDLVTALVRPDQA